MKITLSQIKCHIITIYCFILMIQLQYINNAKTLRYINVCICSVYEMFQTTRAKVAPKNLIYASHFSATEAMYEVSQNMEFF